MSRGSSRVRPDRVAEQIRHETAQILQWELKDPRIRSVTCTRVHVSGDLGVAKVYVSVLGDEAEQRQTMKALQKATGYVRHLLSQRLGLRVSPEVRFIFDPSVEYSIRLEKILDETKQGSEKDPEPGEEPEPKPSASD
jgi:ribosome-binding factor A